MRRKLIPSLIISLLMLFLASCAVPAPTEENTTVIEGRLLTISTCCDGGDVNFRLEGHENMFYLNRAIEAGFDMETFESEVAIGDTVYIRAFTKYLPDESGNPTIIGVIPSAEIATEEKVYYSTMPDSP